MIKGFGSAGKAGMRRLAVLLLLLHGFIAAPVLAYAQKIQTVPSFAMPVWIPFIGAAAAILAVALAAGWLYWNHKKLDESREKKQRAREQELEFVEMRSILCSARHELAFFYMSCKEGAGDILEQIREGCYLEHIVPVEHERYYIYPICASSIGKIRDALLGRHILFAYTKQIRFIETMKWNNNLLRWLREARKRHMEYGDENTIRAREELVESLKEHVPKMTAAFDEMEAATKIVLEYINEDGTVNPRSKHKLHSRYYFLNSPQSVRYR